MKLLLEPDLCAAPGALRSVDSSHLNALAVGLRARELV